MSVVLEQRKKKEVQSSFRVGEEVLISPQVTNEKEWIRA